MQEKPVLAHTLPSTIPSFPELASSNIAETTTLISKRNMDRDLALGVKVLPGF
jgi:hypothetical protein